MAKIVRFNGDLVPFASASLGTERTIFGQVTQANDITSQYTAEFLRGWGIVGPSDQPTLQDFNAVSYTHGQILAYLHQMGVAEYNAAQEYHLGSLCNVAGTVYKSLINTNIGNTPASSPSQWSTLVSPATDTAAGIVELATPAEAVTGTDTQRAVTPQGLLAARMRRVNRVASSTVQAIVGTSVAPAIFTPLNVSFTADGGMYQIFVKINLTVETINAATAPSNAAVIKLLNGATALDISAQNISVPEVAGRSMVLSWSGVIAPGAVTLTVTFEKTWANGSITLNGDRDDNTTNASGQLSVIDVYRMGA